MEDAEPLAEGAGLRDEEYDPAAVLCRGSEGARERGLQRSSHICSCVVPNIESLGQAADGFGGAAAADEGQRTQGGRKEKQRKEEGGRGAVGGQREEHDGGGKREGGLTLDWDELRFLLCSDPGTSESRRGAVRVGGRREREFAEEEEAHRPCRFPFCP